MHFHFVLLRWVSVYFTLYQTESLELHHLISHLSKICSLGQSVPHLPSCISVTVGSWTVTRPASPAAYQMFVRSVEWQSICSTVKATRRNSHCEICGMIRPQSQTSSTWITDARRRVAGLLQQQQFIWNHCVVCLSVCITHVGWRWALRS